MLNSIHNSETAAIAARSLNSSKTKGVEPEADSAVNKRNFDTFEITHSDQKDQAYQSASVSSVQSTNGGIYDSANYYSTSIPLTQMACNISGVEFSNGSPVIHNSSDYAIYNTAYRYLRNFTPINAYNQYSPGPIGKEDREETIFTYDHQYFLYALTDKYTNKAAYAEQGYEIDAYLLMGIAFGESNASKYDPNHFGATADVSQSRANARAVQALRDCGLARNSTEAAALIELDPFYMKAAEVLGFMDNGLDYGTPLNENYVSLNKVMPNVNRWRTAVANGSTNEEDYAYKYF